MKAWVAKKQGSTCPVCRVAIDPSKLERFSVAEPAPPPTTAIDPDGVPKSRREIDYNMIGISFLRLAFEGSFIAGVLRSTDIWRNSNNAFVW